MEKYCVSEIGHFLNHLQLIDEDSVFLTGNSGSLLEVLSELESEQLQHHFKNIIVAPEDVSDFVSRYFWKSDLRIVQWRESEDEAYLVARVSALPNVIKVAIDFNPSLRRLNRIYQIIDTDSVVILRQLNTDWKTVFPMLFSAFRQKICNIINYSAFLVVDAGPAGDPGSSAAASQLEPQPISSAMLHCR